jgi:predicted DNA-binding protein
MYYGIMTYEWARQQMYLKNLKPRELKSRLSYLWNDLGKKTYYYFDEFRNDMAEFLELFAIAEAVGLFR